MYFIYKVVNNFKAGKVEFKSGKTLTVSEVGEISHLLGWLLKNNLVLKESVTDNNLIPEAQDDNYKKPIEHKEEVKKPRGRPKKEVE